MAQELRVYYGNNPPNVCCYELCNAFCNSHSQTTKQQHISLVISSQEVIRGKKRITAAKCIISPPEKKVASLTRWDVNTIKLYLFSAWSSALCFRVPKWACRNSGLLTKTSKRTSPFHCQTFQRLPCQDAERLRRQISTGGKKEYLVYASNICAKVTDVIITSWDV